MTRPCRQTNQYPERPGPDTQWTRGGRPELTTAVWGLRRLRQTLASEDTAGPNKRAAQQLWVSEWSLVREERHKCSIPEPGPRVMSHVRSSYNVDTWEKSLESLQTSWVYRVNTPQYQWSEEVISFSAHRSAPRYRWPLLSWNETIWLLQIITFRHHGEITRYLMWHSDWGQRFPGDNKDVILRGCPFSMSQVNYYLVYFSLVFVRMIKIVPLVVLFWPHVFST